MKGLSTRLEDQLHRRQNRVVFEKEVPVQDFVYHLLETGTEKAEKELKQEGECK